ncbi:armadillo beta-catenin plakoglobin [Thelephora terrestris]|uniref:uracil phosphoribosyltransferase n=1 Tax=Thelephora terrestris TaxID=56493 RepID=A0A9P6LDN5_9AGAM|nr:armadillo beta-catenin plakoglobin [Thelephora terrestris]
MPGKVNVLRHPVVNSRLVDLRQTGTSPKEFRQGIHDISTILAIEATRDLEEEPVAGQSPVGPFFGSTIKPKIGLTPVLRAGLGMTDALLGIFPNAPVYHLGIYREKVSLQPVEYYSKLPSGSTVDMVFLLDPIIATGGTVIAATHMLTDWGVPITRIKLLSILASRDGLKSVQGKFPDLEVWVAAVDDQLTQNGLICPGLGDAGDRLYNTLKE